MTVVGPDWQLFALPFSELRQAGWGRSSPALDVAALRSLTLLFPEGVWDIWIDDIAYYRRPAS